jgi:tetratricopeptide (TPR) repeat protein
MKALTTVLAALLVVPALFAARVPNSPPAKDKHTMALENYQSGRERLDKIAKMHEELRATSDAKVSQKLQNKVQKQLENAAADFQRAVKYEPTLFQAWSELGFAQRKLGRFDESLQAYDKALSIQPNFGPAIEYRAEAYLGLNRIEEAKEAYTLLFSGDRALANDLFNAMKQWVAERRSNPSGIDAQKIDQFGQWVAQREAVHRQTSALAPQGHNARAW